MKDQCKYCISWVGRCTEDSDYGKDKCKEHADEVCCECGKPAYRECEETYSAVCGYPLCNECTHKCRAKNR